jgi:hypothetical protein
MDLNSFLQLLLTHVTEQNANIPNPQTTNAKSAIYQAFIFGVSNWLYECKDQQATLPISLEEIISSCDPYFLRILTTYPAYSQPLKDLLVHLQGAERAIQPEDFLYETYTMVYDPNLDILHELENGQPLSDSYKEKLNSLLFTSAQAHSPSYPVLPYRNHKKTRRLTGHRAVTPIKRHHGGRKAHTLKKHT